VDRNKGCRVRKDIDQRKECVVHGGDEYFSREKVAQRQGFLELILRLRGFRGEKRIFL